MDQFILEDLPPITSKRNYLPDTASSSRVTEYKLIFSGENHTDMRNYFANDPYYHQYGGLAFVVKPCDITGEMSRHRLMPSKK